MFQLTAARRRLVFGFSNQPTCQCFNSQPPEGGWPSGYKFKTQPKGFNSQPPEGGWVRRSKHTCIRYQFQLTAARRRLGAAWIRAFLRVWVSTHSRPKAAGPSEPGAPSEPGVSTHSRPKAAGFSHSFAVFSVKFQLTAARRRLVKDAYDIVKGSLVSTHSRPKAAGGRCRL